MFYLMRKYAFSYLNMIELNSDMGVYNALIRPYYYPGKWLRILNCKFDLHPFLILTVYGYNLEMRNSVSTTIYDTIFNFYVKCKNYETFDLPTYSILDNNTFYNINNVDYYGLISFNQQMNVTITNNRFYMLGNISNSMG